MTFLKSGYKATIHKTRYQTLNQLLTKITKSIARYISLRNTTLLFLNSLRTLIGEVAGDFGNQLHPSGAGAINGFRNRVSVLCQPFWPIEYERNCNLFSGRHHAPSITAPALRVACFVV